MLTNPPSSAGDIGLIPGLEGSPGEGHGNPLQSTVHGVLATVYGVTEVKHDSATKQQHVSSCLLGCNSLLHLDHRLWSAFLATKQHGVTEVKHDSATKQQHVSSCILGCNSLLHLDNRLWSAFLFFPFDPLPFHFLLT